MTQTSTNHITDPTELVDALAAMVATYALPSLYAIVSCRLPETAGTELERAQRVMTFAGETGATLTETNDTLSATLELGRWPAVAHVTLSTGIAAPEVARRYAVPDPLCAHGFIPDGQACGGHGCTAPALHAEGGHDQ
jgi:hypothetical protein